MDSDCPTWFDTHVHLDAFASPAEALREAQHARVGAWLVPGVSELGWPRLIDLADRHPGVYAAPGIHPQAASEWNESTVEQLAAALEHPRSIAIGEIGLDRLLDTPTSQQQEAVLRAQLRLAVELGKPVLIHCRKGYGKLLEMLSEARAEKVGGILHAYGGSVETARTAIDLGFAIAFGGSLTWPEARRAPEVLAALPEEAVVLETDAPYMSPHPHRGAPNRPARLRLTGEKVAEIRGWSLAETAAHTTRNARRVLNLAT